jgi:secreted PhoX family phosphatase
VFKFIPTNLWTGGAPITDLANSPLTAGRIFGLRVGRNNGTTPDSGWGNEYGRGWWVEVTGRADVGSTPINLRNAALTLKLTGYYRPEDAEFDGKEFALGNVRFCGTNTGQDTTDTGAVGDNHWGEVYCLRDSTFTAAAVTTTATQTISGVNYSVLTGTVPEYQALVLGNKDFAMMDNIAYHPTRGFWVLNEDGDGATWTPKRNNDIWACLDDGADADKLSDSCVKLMTLNDLMAETTGGTFDATGTRYFVSVQHPNTNHGIILEINGWIP